jgi:hypothetical protein
MKESQYRHGDLLICSITQIPDGAVKRANNVIIEGTATGHHHTLSGVVGTAIMELNDKVYISVPDSGAVTHEEHNTIVLPKGNYRVIFQNEYDPYERAARQVID